MGRVGNKKSTLFLTIYISFFVDGTFLVIIGIVRELDTEKTIVVEEQG